MNGEITSYHVKYYSHFLKRKSLEGVDRLSQALHDAQVDLNPHQVEAALFALRSPLAKGVLLADEVGLGKTIEAGLILCQYWAEQKRHLLIICPASLRTQWAAELREKFFLDPLILDQKVYRDLAGQGKLPFTTRNQVIICSYQFAARMNQELRKVSWNLVIIDEAHKLRNCYRPSNVLGQSLHNALSGVKKVLLSATPLQNSLMELYGLTHLIDDEFFGDPSLFRQQYVNQGRNLDDLRQRIKPLVHRTLRKQVLEYVKYTARKPITIPFTPSQREQELYESVSTYLQQQDTYGLPRRFRHLTTLIIRKLLSSSSYAIAGTLKTIRLRLEKIKTDSQEHPSWKQFLKGQGELDDDLLDEILEELEEGDLAEMDEPETEQTLDPEALMKEIRDLESFELWAQGIGVDTKTQALLTALDTGFAQLEAMGAPRKAVIFTESKRTQDYLASFLNKNGFSGKVVVFNGTNNSPEAIQCYDQWYSRHKDSDRVTHVRKIDTRAALIDKFKNEAEIFLATEAGAEGVNLQFSSLLINYDLPWNPQRVEQRIGRIHRYGQKFDVVVINFLNQTNRADQRVKELLEEKFQLFAGVFGASDEILGTIESGVDFEKRILDIYQTCRSPEEIDAAFNALQAELEAEIQARISETRTALMENFDEDVHGRLKGSLDDTRRLLDQTAHFFWESTKVVLSDLADFDQDDFRFQLHNSPSPDIPKGSYSLASVGKKTESDHLYRLGHPLGDHVLLSGMELTTPPAHLIFEASKHPTKIAMVQNMKGLSGTGELHKVSVTSLDEVEDHLVFTGFTDEGTSVDQETMEKFFKISGKVEKTGKQPLPSQRMEEEFFQRKRSLLARIHERNQSFFNEERERLDRWADDQVKSLDEELSGIKKKIQEFRRQERVAETLSDQKEIQKKIAEFEKKKRQLRMNIFEEEDKIIERRDALIARMEAKLEQNIQVEPIFQFRWTIT